MNVESDTTTPIIYSAKICEYCNKIIKGDNLFQIGKILHTECIGMNLIKEKEQEKEEEKLILDKISHANPEQYFVFDNKDMKNMVGYIRVRFGCIEVWGGDLVIKLFEKRISDNEWLGEFNTEDERIKYLDESRKIISHWINDNGI